MFLTAQKIVSFFTAGSWEKGTIFGAARKNFGPSYIVTSLGCNQMLFIAGNHTQRDRKKYSLSSPRGFVTPVKYLLDSNWRCLEPT